MDQPLRNAISLRVSKKRSPSRKRRATIAHPGELSWASKARLLQQWGKAEVAILREKIQNSTDNTIVIRPQSDEPKHSYKQLVDEYIQIKPENNSVVQAYQLFDPESPQDRTSEYCYALSKGRRDFAELLAKKQISDQSIVVKHPNRET